MSWTRDRNCPEDDRLQDGQSGRVDADEAGNSSITASAVKSKRLKTDDCAVCVSPVSRKVSTHLYIFLKGDAADDPSDFPVDSRSPKPPQPQELLYSETCSSSCFLTPSKADDDAAVPDSWLPSTHFPFAEVNIMSFYFLHLFSFISTKTCYFYVGA